MYKWYLSQRLSVKLVLPSILIVVLLALAGVYVYILAREQQTLQQSINSESRSARKLSSLIESYNRTQSHLYKSVALSFAGIDKAKITKDMAGYISMQPMLEKDLADLASLKVFASAANDFKTIQTQSSEYFKWVKEVSDNFDDPGMAASNMVTTETKFSNLRQTLESIFNLQEKRMSLVIKNAESSLTGLTRGQLVSTIVVAIIAIGISLLNLWMFKSFVNKAKEDVGIIAKGDFAHELSVTSGDELGELAMSVEQMRKSIHGLLGGLKTTALRLTESSTTLHELSGELTRDASTVDDRTNVISSAGRDVSNLADRMAHEAQNVSKGSASTASSLEEMKNTIQEISRNCIREVEMAQSSAKTVGDVIEGMNELGKASKEIGGILKMIDDIAGKTRLLALNATIEAASAGEAGRGFSVVAEEVKALAVQSNSAASQIEQKISAMQSQVDNAIRATKEISNVIEQFSEISRTISAAVEEQSVTVSEIAKAVGEVSQSSNELVCGMEDVSKRSLQVLNAIKDVGEVVKSTAKEAGLTSENSGTLKAMANELNSSVARFTV